MAVRECSPRLRMMVLCLALLPGAVWGGGVTVITHGHISDVNEWVIPMAEEMAVYHGDGVAESNCCVLVVPASGPAFWQGGKTPDLTSTGETFIKLDWSDGQNLFGGISSQAVALVAVNALMDPAMNPQAGGPALAELPLHLVGHSRGSSVVSEMAREFGERGVWVDQVTTLDPRPAFSDANVVLSQNVFYADNYWQDQGGFLVPIGQPISGAYNRYLTNLEGANSPHSNVHLWYHGTVDLSTPSTSAEAEITGVMRGSWYESGELAGAAAGYWYSRFGGGDRFETFQPAGGDQVVAGMNKFWDVGAGVSANRTALTSSGAWPNVIRCWRTGSGTLSAGGSLELGFYHQSGTTGTGDVEVEVLLDVDRNPWNGNEVVLDAGVVGKTGVSAVGLETVSIDPGATAPGVYFAALRLEDGTKSRVLYAAEMVEVVVPVAPMIDGGTVRVEGGMMKFMVVGEPGLMVVVEASEDLGELDDWDEVGSGVLVGGMWEFSDPDTGMYQKRFYRLFAGVPPP